MTCGQSCARVRVICVMSKKPGRCAGHRSVPTSRHMAKNCEWDARENPACDCEVPSGFWQPWAWGQDDVFGHHLPSDASADGFGKKWYQKSRRGKRRSNERAKTLNYLRRSWHELNKEYQRCCAKGHTFEVGTWVYQNVNMDVHLRQCDTADQAAATHPDPNGRGAEIFDHGV